MGKFERGVDWYTTGMLPVHFPEDAVCCRYCILLENDYKLDRSICRRTGEIIVAPDVMRGQNCPIIFEEVICLDH